MENVAVTIRLSVEESVQIYILFAVLLQQGTYFEGVWFKFMITDDGICIYLFFTILYV